MRYPIICVVGWHSVGKTSLIERLVAELGQRGLRTAVIKHTGSHFNLDHEGTDTWRFARAGANVVGIVGPHGLAIIENTEEEATLEEVLRRLPRDLALIIVEGYKTLDLPKIEVRPDWSSPPMPGLTNVIAIVAPGEPQPAGEDVASFALEDTRGLAAWLAEKILHGGD